MKKTLVLIPLILALGAPAAFAFGHHHGSDRDQSVDHPAGCPPGCQVPDHAGLHPQCPPACQDPDHAGLHAQCPPRPALGPGRGPAADGRLLERLDLDEETRARTGEIRDRADAQSAAIRERIDAALAELRASMDAEDWDPEQILRQAAHVEDLRKEEHLLRLEAVLRVHSLLTPEQRAELRAMREELRPDRRGDRPYRRHHRPHHR